MTDKEMLKKIADSMSNDADVVAYCTKKIEQIDNRTAKTRARLAAKKASDPMKDELFAVLTNEFQTITDIVAATNDTNVTPRKAVTRLNAMVEDGKVMKDVLVKGSEKGKKKAVAFKLAA